MEICSNGHEEICYAVALCPMCLIILGELRLQIKDLKKELEDTKNE